MKEKLDDFLMRESYELFSYSSIFLSVILIIIINR